MSGHAVAWPHAQPGSVTSSRPRRGRGVVAVSASVLGATVLALKVEGGILPRGLGGLGSTSRFG